jgi:hypothetical protein
MSVPRRRLVTVVTLLTLLAPAGALAQSAGDDEYQNPLPPPEPTETQRAQSEPEAPAAAAPAQAEPAPAAPQSTAAPAAELPRTGLPAGIIGGAGVLLLAGGAGLRRRT